MRWHGYPRKVLTAAGVKVFVDGNSLTFGAGSSANAKRWPDVALTLPPWLGTGVTAINTAVSGQSIQTLGTAPSTMIARAPSVIHAALDPSKLNVIFSWEGINEMTQNGGSAAGCLSAYASYHAAIRTAAASAGAKVFIIVATTPPAMSAVLTTPQMVARNEAFKILNAALRANCRAYGADICEDVAAFAPFSTIFAAGTYTLAEFQNAGVYNRSDGTANDYIHFGDSGYALKAQISARAATRIRK